jgi:LmbE family N-acetylglucosaminyl deacetylase
MGGTIAKHVEAGDDVLMVVATVPSQRELRTQEARAGAEVLGARLEILDIPSDDLGVNRRTIREFDRLLTSIDPHLVYTHWDQDSHQDHNAVSRAILAAGRRNRCSVLMYEQTIPGGVTPGGFKAQSFVDITDYIDRKCRSILVHRTQIDQNGGDWWLDGVRGRAMYRGYQMNAPVRGGVRGGEGDRGPLRPAAREPPPAERSRRPGGATRRQWGTDLADASHALNGFHGYSKGRALHARKAQVEPG